jgi:hypothetical protein
MAAIDCTAVQLDYAILNPATQREGGHVSHAVIAKCGSDSLERLEKSYWEGVIPHVFATQIPR